MISIQVFLSAEAGMLEGITRDHLVEATGLRIGVLKAGMQSGKPSVAFAIELPDGRVVFAETSLLLFQTAARALSARYGDLTEMN